jgi:hypothetical protein
MSDPVFASALRIVRSDTGHIHLQLLDEDGAVFAVAAVDVDYAPVVSRGIERHRKQIMAAHPMQNLAPAGHA